MKDAKKLIIPLLRAALSLDEKIVFCDTCEEKCEELTLSSEEIGEVMRLAYWHSLQNLVAEALLESGMKIDSAVRQKLEAEQHRALFSDTNRAHALSEIGEALGAAGIDYMPLKGSVIKHLYPRTDMRSSCDIDILVKKQDLSRATECVEALGTWKLREKGPHDIAYASESGVSLELHFSLVGDKDRFANALLDVWENAKPAEDGAHHYLMSDEDFYLYTVIHAAKHFLTGGCGIRTLIDIFYWRRSKSLDESYLESRTRKFGVYEFMCAFEALSEHWFGESGENGLNRADSASPHPSFASQNPPSPLGKANEAVCAPKPIGSSTNLVGAIHESPAGSSTNLESGENPDGDLIARLAEYIIDNATFGTIENRIAIERSADGKSAEGKRKGRFAYLVERCFMPYRQMKHRYPVLKKLPILLPMFWVVRWIEAIVRGQGGVIRDSIALNQSLSEEKREQIARLYSDIGLIK